MSRWLFLIGLVVVVTSPAFAQVQVFVTSQTYDGALVDGENFIGLAGGDEACRDAAAAADLPGTWTAWLSDDTTDAVDRILNAVAPYQLLDGTVIADNLADLLDGTLNNPINVDEFGEVVNANVGVWTGTGADGTALGGVANTCEGWNSDQGGATGLIGEADVTGADWTNDRQDGCEQSNRLYCFSDVEVPVELQEFSVE